MRCKTRTGRLGSIKAPQKHVLGQAFDPDMDCVLLSFFSIYSGGQGCGCLVSDFFFKLVILLRVNHFAEAYMPVVCISFVLPS